MRSDIVLAMHAYIPEQNLVLTEIYRNLVNMVNGT